MPSTSLVCRRLVHLLVLEAVRLVDGVLHLQKGLLLDADICGFRSDANVVLDRELIEHFFLLGRRHVLIESLAPSEVERLWPALLETVWSRQAARGHIAAIRSQLHQLAVLALRDLIVVKLLDHAVKAGCRVRHLLLEVIVALGRVELILRQRQLIGLYRAEAAVLLRLVDEARRLVKTAATSRSRSCLQKERVHLIHHGQVLLVHSIDRLLLHGMLSGVLSCREVYCLQSQTTRRAVRVTVHLVGDAVLHDLERVVGHGASSLGTLLVVPLHP